MKKLVGLSILAMVALAGCASSMPGWVSGGQSKDYHTNQYLTAVGEGDDVDSAGEQARQKLGKVFGPRFDYKALNSLSLGNVVVDGKPQNLHAKRASEIVDRQMSKLVEGIRVVENWENPKTKRVFALAVLPRAQAVAKLNEELYSLDRATQSYLSEEKRKSDTLDKIQLATLAIDTQVARRSMTRSLQDVDRKGRASSEAVRRKKEGRPALTHT